MLIENRPNAPVGVNFSRQTLNSRNRSYVRKRFRGYRQWPTRWRWHSTLIWIRPRSSPGLLRAATAQMLTFAPDARTLRSGYPTTTASASGRMPRPCRNFANFASDGPAITARSSASSRAATAAGRLPLNLADTDEIYSSAHVARDMRVDQDVAFSADAKPGSGQSVSDRLTQRVRRHRGSICGEDSGKQRMFQCMR